MKAACKGRAQEVANNDNTTSLGPPDKKQHFDNSQTKVQTKKGQFKIANNGGEVDIDN